MLRPEEIVLQQLEIYKTVFKKLVEYIDMRLGLVPDFSPCLVVIPGCYVSTPAFTKRVVNRYRAIGWNVRLAAPDKLVFSANFTLSEDSIAYMQKYFLTQDSNKHVIFALKKYSRTESFSYELIKCQIINKQFVVYKQSHIAANSVSEAKKAAEKELKSISAHIESRKEWRK